MSRFDAWLTRAARLIPTGRPSLLATLGIVAATLTAATLARLALTPLLGDSAPFITYFPAIVVAAVWGHLLGGLAVLLGSALLAISFWMGTSTATATGAWGWVPTTVVFLITGGIEIVVAVMLRLALAESDQSRQEADLIALEMRHRIGNLLALVQSLAQQTARGSENLDSFRSVFDARLQAIARVQTVQLPAEPHRTNLRRVLDVAIAPFSQAAFHLNGDDMEIPPESVTQLALLLHELGTNAVKYGALKTENGRVHIEWSRSDRLLELVWKERDGPPVVIPTRTGFGTRLISAIIPPAAGSSVVRYEPDGLRCNVQLRLTD